MGQAVYLGLCLLGCLIFNPVVEGAKNGTAAGRARCAPGALYYKQFCYIFNSYFVSWHLAEVTCQGLNTGPESHLVSILFANEGKIISSYLSKKGISDIWIGLEATRSNGYMVWEWSDVSPLSLPLWDGRTLSSAISANECVSMTNIRNTNAQKWLQRACNDTLPFLCKYRAEY
ncbi:lithostathine-1-alpha-like [Eublepharis macularius]|uniref:Lithostathine-1-alpha-like n=1 Tax=Eublepharis macularius TaxID=481883 RepID=A0AA97JXB0_EUBMA|nr:lithostathine-1-alpha-like [Eublepharis macularius]